MINFKAAIVGALAFVGTATAASATTTVSIPEEYGVNNFTSYSGSLDLSAYLTDAAGNQFELTDALLTVAGYSRGAATAQVYAGQRPIYGQVTESYRCGFFSTCYRTVTQIINYQPIYRDSDTVVDTLSVQVGNASGSGSTVSDGYDIYGNASASTSLGADELAAVNTSKVLNYLVTGQTNTSFDVTSGSLTFNVRQLVVAPVPEPASWAMMIVGIGVMGYALRRQKAAAGVARTA